MFVDEVEIEVKAGNGGDGCVAFLREKYRPMGGPAGGDGGRGGSIVFQAHPGLRTLADFRGKRIIQAKNGMPGEGKNRAGKSAKNLVVQVPVGTIIKDRKTGDILADLTKPKQKVIIAKGGNGGRGNQHFATPTHQSPRKFEKGEPGEARKLILELRLLADVGLVGLPNAGKSTLIGAVSTVKPKVGDYQFTTLLPSVGIVRVGENSSFTMADIPGIIEYAHQGKGLGLQFLRHIKRTSLIAHLIEIPLYFESDSEIIEHIVYSYKTIRRELELYSSELSQKPEIVCITKSDILPEDDRIKFESDLLPEFIKKTGCPEPVFIISAVTRYGLTELIGHFASRLNFETPAVEEEKSKPEYIDGEPPENLTLSELSMENLDEMETDE